MFPRRDFLNLMSDYDYRRPTFYEREEAAGTILIGMDSEGSLKVAGQGHEAIATFGLCGCSAVAVVLENPDNTEYIGIVAHYSPLAINARQHDRLRTLLQQHGSDGWKATAYIITPGSYGTHPETGAPYSLLPQNEAVGLFSSILHADLPMLHGVSVHAYSEVQMADATEQGTVIIRFNSEGVRVFIEGIPV